ncbi:MAG TPA: SH3 domain-containing protein [Anaerolineales bacterium]|nr:SH3 domain-containing protein [Anaerolineales bacterium]HNM38314.1 SH3 domain-containing protein [Anaerolineales bacterium]HNO93555.1 SH3 domain-containing protein [Anaerolineales bacterium]
MDLKPYLNRFVIVGSLITAGILILITLILIGWTSPRFSPEVGFAPADLTMIPAPTHTPAASPTPTLDPFAPPTVDATTIHIDGYVQIIEVGTDGLRIRSAPGLNTETVFLGGESEVFLVKDGPQDADGYTWWYLVASYDDTRAGWAASEFLTVVPPPQ